MLDPGAHRFEADALIVGGGVAGLSAAWRFLRAGFEDFVLLELEPEPGGTARSGEAHGVVPYPWGAHYLPAPRKENRALVALLDGTQDRDALRAALIAAGRPASAEELELRLRRLAEHAMLLDS
jgi:phytoene dehydrogenase-like protein